MVENEFEYIEYLVQNGLKNTSAYSYGRYLEAVSKYLEISVNRNTVSSNQDVNHIIDRLSETDLAENYKNNCGTALRGYLRFHDQVDPVFSYPEEILNHTDYIEGAKKQITINSYERDTGARNKAIEIHGLNCSVCDINFEDFYGKIGLGFIHVHHLKPLHKIDETYNVNPETDLVPVCPNCHAMLHRSLNPPSIEELKEAILNLAQN